MPAPSFPRTNNLEWLRLIFATQVVVMHSGEHLGFAVPGIISHFPGVPAFFFVSGFLIYASYLNAPGRRYFENRFLRLYPALLFVTLGAALIVLIAHGFHDLRDHFRVYGIWFVAQTTLGQAYNPSLFRDVGVGVINGSLWTLTTEMLFYLTVPIVVWLEHRFRFAVLVLIGLSFAIYAAGPVFFGRALYGSKNLFDFLALTPIVWGWMFGFGILALKNFKVVERGLKYLPIAVLPMTAMILFGSGIMFGSVGNRLGLLYFACYVCLVLWFGFAVPYVPLRFDLSYGTYVWHMPIINLLLVSKINPGITAFILAGVLTFAVATLSWFVVEKPALKLKRRSLKPVH